jgi:hypothetical protein
LISAQPSFVRTFVPSTVLQFAHNINIGVAMKRCQSGWSSFALFAVVVAWLTHAACGVDVNFTVVPFKPMDGPPSTSASGRPFVLIHQAKCAGSAMRAVIFKQFSTKAFIDSGVTANDTCIPCSWFGKVRSNTSSWR